MKRATCLGTNYIGTGSDLSECVNDAKDLSSLLEGQGFLVDTYLEKEVTRTRFLAELAAGVNRAVAKFSTGEVNTHSGHGTEADDALGVTHQGLYFTDGVVWDYEIADIISKIPTGFPFFIFWDTCFSGGALKSTKNKIRFVHTDEIPAAIPSKRLKEAITENAIYISACSDTEYSYDATALNNGAGTYYLKTTFEDNISFVEWFNRVREHLPSEEYPQTPQLICKEELKSKLAFGWFDGVATGVDDVVVDKPPIILTLSFWQRLWNWIKNLFK